MTRPNLAHPALSPDIPGHVVLTAYSLDATRSYALERDRLSESYKDAAARLIEAVALFDINEDVAELAAVREALGTLRSVAEQMRHLEPPTDLEGHSAELATFSADLAVRSTAIESAIGAAQSHAQRKADQVERARILKSNNAAGLPFHHGLPDHLITLDDANAIPGFWDNLDRQSRGLVRFKLGQQQRRLESDEGFSFSEALTASVENVEGSARAFAMAQAMASKPKSHGPEPAPANGAIEHAQEAHG